MAHTRWSNNETRYKAPGQPYINDELAKFEDLLSAFCEITGIDRSRIEINYQALKDVILRVDMRELYFNIYHNGMKINEYKFTVLECFWLLKLHPFWMRILESDDEEVMQLATCINEKLAAHLMCSTLAEYNLQFFKDGRDLAADYCQELEYSFRYRDLSKEAMYLMADPFYYMALFDRAVAVNGDPLI